MHMYTHKNVEQKALSYIIYVFDKWLNITYFSNTSYISLGEIYGIIKVMCAYMRCISVYMYVYIYDIDVYVCIRIYGHIARSPTLGL